MGKKINTQQILQIGNNNNKYIWDAKYFEKHNKESHIYLFQNLELKRFLQKFLKNNGLSLYKYKIHFLESTLRVFISYFKTSKIKTIVPKINTIQKIRLVKKASSLKKVLWDNYFYKKIRKKKFIKHKRLNKKTIVKFSNFYKKIRNRYNKKTSFLYVQIRKMCQVLFFRYNLVSFFEKKKSLFKINFFLCQKYMQYWQSFKKAKCNLIFKHRLKNFYNKYLVKKVLPTFLLDNKFKNLLATKFKMLIKFFLIKKSHSHNQLLSNFLLNEKLYKKRLKSLRYYKTYMQLQKNRSINNVKINNLLEQCSESLNNFTKNKFKYSLILNQVNKNISFNLTYRQLQSMKKLVTQLRQFKNSNFLKEGINVILTSLLNPNSTHLLVNFISTQLELVKRHGFFFKFLTKTLSLLVKHKFSKVKSIRIFIKGRINGKPRAKYKSIFINKDMSLMTLNSSTSSVQSTAYSANGTFGVKLWLN